MKPDPANDGLISWLKANPGPALSASAAALGIIVAIAAIIAIDNLAGKVIGGILFSLVAVMIFVANWLWGHTNGKQMSVSILSAVALAFGTGVVIWAVTPARDADVIRYVTRPASATITIDQPTPGALVGPRPDISGSLTNLGTNQHVWMFSQPYSTSRPYLPLSHAGPFEQCEVSKDRTHFDCPKAFNGATNGDYCRMALLWVSVVNSEQADQLSGAAQLGSTFARTWPNPPYADESSDYVLVRRSPPPGRTCSS